MTHISSAAELEVALVESGKQDIIEVDGPNPVIRLLHSHGFLEQGIAEEEVAVLEAV